MSASASPGARVFWGWALLLAVVGLNFGLSYVDVGHARIPIALVLGGASAAILLLEFMEVRRASLSVKIALFAAAALLTLLIGLMIGDVALRGTPPLVPPGAPAAGVADIPSHAE